MTNQSPPYGGINLFETDPLANSAASGFPDSVREDLSELGAFWGTHEARDFSRLANRHSPELERYNSHGERIDQVNFHPAYHALMRRSMLAGLHSSAFDRGEDEAGLRHRARALRLYMTAQTECGHLCPMTMTNASLATLKHAPDLLGIWAPKILSRSYDRNFRPVADKRGATIGMGMTEKQGGTDVRANTTRAEPAGDDNLYRLTGHKWFFSAPMSDAFLVLAQAARGSPASSCRASFPTDRRMRSGWSGSKTSSAIDRTPPPRSSSTAHPPGGSATRGGGYRPSSRW